MVKCLQFGPACLKKMHRMPYKDVRRQNGPNMLCPDSRKEARAQACSPHGGCWTGRACAAVSLGCHGPPGGAEVAAAAARHASRPPSQRAGPCPAAAEATHIPSHRPACSGHTPEPCYHAPSSQFRQDSSPPHRCRTQPHHACHICNPTRNFRIERPGSACNCLVRACHPRNNRHA